MAYLLARTLDEALDFLGREGAGLIAGGTDYFPTKQKGVAVPPLVDVSRIPELCGVMETDDEWCIGGATTWSQLIASDTPRAFDGLKAAAREVGSVQIQNVATIAGNICNASPAADGVPALLALKAEVELVSATGKRRLALASFLRGVRQTDLQPGEVLSAILIPKVPSHAIGDFEKLGSRRYLVISITMAGSVIGVNPKGEIDFARIAVGACSPVAQRQYEIEKSIIGSKAKDVVISPEALQNLSPIDDVRGDAEYRMIAAAEQCTRLVQRCGQ